MSHTDPLIFVVAGESSGDNLGGRLLQALTRLTAGRARFAGIGGPTMTAQGLQSLFPMRDLALIGLTEILPHLPRLIRRMGETVAHVQALKPDLVVTIDSPGFNFRLAKRIRSYGGPIVHYVAPQLWAWRPARGHRLRGVIDRMLVLLPFEPEFFAQFGVPCTFVGHSIVESGADQGDAVAFRTHHGLKPDQPIVILMPGSRTSEVKRLLPTFKAAAEMLASRHPGLTAVVPTVDATAETVEHIFSGTGISSIFPSQSRDKFDAFAAATAAITKSGTSTLEIALAGVPMVVAYRVSAATAALVRHWITVDRVALVNLLAGRDVVPELLQERCTPATIAAALDTLLTDQTARRDQRIGLAEAVAKLGEREPPPSERAARAVLDTIGWSGTTA